MTKSIEDQFNDLNDLIVNGNMSIDESDALIQKPKRPIPDELKSFEFLDRKLLI